ncbi:MAG: hypothetical protein ACPHL6_06650 [Rubripirellula sp.]
MARVGIIFGLLLIGISVAAMLQTPEKSPSQFYSMMFGIPTFFCGIVALNPHRRRQSMLIATLLTVTGLLSGLVWISLNLIRDPSSNGSPDHPNLLPIIGMTATCGIFLFYSLIAFSQIRKRK